MNKNESLDIAEVSKATGLPASALRYYEDRGLIQSIGRRGIRRLFPSTILERISLIALGQMAGFSLDEIASMLTSQGPKIDRAKLIEKANQIDQKIAQLKAMSEGLRHAAVCNAPNHSECPKFQKLLKIGSAQLLKKRSQHSP